MDVPVPVSSKQVGSIPISCNLNDDGHQFTDGLARVQGNGKILVRRPDSSDFTIGNISFEISGSYLID